MFYLDKLKMDGKEKDNIKESKFSSAFQKKPYQRTDSERIIVAISKVIAIFLFLCIILKLMVYPVNIIKETSKEAEKRQYQSVAKEIGVNEKEIILTSKFFKPGIYTAETSKGTYTVQFGNNYTIKRIVKED